MIAFLDRQNIIIKVKFKEIIMSDDKVVPPIDELVRHIVREVIAEEEFTPTQVEKIVRLLIPNIQEIIAEEVTKHIKAIISHFNSYAAQL